MPPNADTSNSRNDNDVLNNNKNAAASKQKKKQIHTLFDNKTPSSPNYKAPSALDKLIGRIVVGSFVSIWISSLSSPVIMAYGVYSQNWFLVGALTFFTAMAYLPWKRGAFCEWVQSWYEAPYFRLYKSFQFLCEQELPNDNPNGKPTFYAVHTHGAFCMGWGAIFSHPLFVQAKVRFCFSPALLASPLFRLFSRIISTPGSASKSSMTSYMRKKQNLALPPGGFEEATVTDLQQDRVFIKKRTGFIKLCLKHGYNVRPVYCFGEKKTYWNLQGAWKPRLALNRAGFPAILVAGWPWMPLVPKHDFDFCIVVGAPLQLPQIDDPTPQQVQQYHQQYMKALQQLFDDHKERAYGPEEGGKDCKLEFW